MVMVRGIEIERANIDVLFFLNEQIDNRYVFTYGFGTVNVDPVPPGTK